MRVFGVCQMTPRKHLHRHTRYHYQVVDGWIFSGYVLVIIALVVLKVVMK